MTHFSPSSGRGAHILDAGCGSGRDALSFSEQGYDVTAFDGSKEMVRLASSYAGLPIVHMSFDEIAWVNEFDGIWACASLLHVERANLPEVMARLANALRNNGLLYASFKFGTSERKIDGRHFTDFDEAGFAKLMEAANLVVVQHQIRPDVRPRRSGELWISGIARRAS